MTKPKVKIYEPSPNWLEDMANNFMTSFTVLLTGCAKKGTTSCRNSWSIAFCMRPNSVKALRAPNVLCTTNSSGSLRP